MVFRGDEGKHPERKSFAIWQETQNWDPDPLYICIGFNGFRGIFCFWKQCDKMSCVLFPFHCPFFLTVQMQSLNRCKIFEQSIFPKYSKPFKRGTQCSMTPAAILDKKRATVPLTPSWSWDVIKLTYWFLWIYKCLFHKLHLQSLGIFRTLSFSPPSKWINYVPT